MKTLKKMRKGVFSMTGIGITGIVGVRTISTMAAGTTVAATAPAGIGRIMGQQPLLGTVMGTGYTLGVFRGAFSFKKKKGGLI